MHLSLKDLNNPLINPPKLPLGMPPLNLIQPKHFQPAFDYGIQLAEQRIEKICSNPEDPTFENTIEPYIFSAKELDRIDPVFRCQCDQNHNDDLEKIKPIIYGRRSEFVSNLIANKRLFARIKTIYEKRGHMALTEEQSNLLENTYEFFTRNGADLSDEDKKRLKEISATLTSLGVQFDANIRNAKKEFQLVITDESELEGISYPERDKFRAEAKKRGLLKGSFCILLDPYPYAITTNCINRKLREKIYTADAELCRGGKYDNVGIATQIIQKRHELAQLLGFKNYADFSISNRAAKSVEDINEFLETMLTHYKKAADSEFEGIRDLAKNEYGLTDFKPWDLAFFMARKKERTRNVSESHLSEGFEIGNVLKEMFSIVEKLFNLKFVEEKSGKYPVYHQDVRTFEVYDKSTGEILGLLCGDFYVRPGSKGAGAHCITLRSNGVVDGIDQFPILICSCDIEKYASDQPVLLSTNQIKTIFHELGHALQVLLTKGRYPSQTGLGNVKSDFSEFSSEFIERFATDPDFLASARHYKTGEVIPQVLLQILLDNLYLHNGIYNLNGIHKSLVDIALHSCDPKTFTGIEDVERQIRSRTSLFDSDYLSSPTFTHIFSGGYAVGYYGYLYAAAMAEEIYELTKSSGPSDTGYIASLHKLFEERGDDSIIQFSKMTGHSSPDPSVLLRAQMPAYSPGIAERRPFRALPTFDGVKQYIRNSLSLRHFTRN